MTFSTNFTTLFMEYCPCVLEDSFHSYLDRNMVSLPMGVDWGFHSGVSALLGVMSWRRKRVIFFTDRVKSEDIICVAGIF